MLICAYVLPLKYYSCECNMLYVCYSLSTTILSICNDGNMVRDSCILCHYMRGYIQIVGIGAVTLFACGYA